MSASNGVVRIGRKGRKKFAFGDGPPFDVEVVEAFQMWIGIDDAFRQEDAEGNRLIPTASMPDYHRAAVQFVEMVASGLKTPDAEPVVIGITIAEALDFIARLREQYDELAVFFRPRSLEKRDSPDTSEEGSQLQFSVEES